jgi:hypothetical protein
VLISPSFAPILHLQPSTTILKNSKSSNLEEDDEFGASKGHKTFKILDSSTMKELILINM